MTGMTNSPPTDPAALEDAHAAARAELERLDVARLQLRASALDVVRDTAAGYAAARAELDEAVAGARAAGATWQQIADATGMARPSAWSRWAKQETDRG